MKEKVAVKFNVLLEQICLIHSGKILYDGEALSGHGIVEDTVVHMVVKSSGVQVYAADLWPVCEISLWPMAQVHRHCIKISKICHIYVVL